MCPSPTCSERGFFFSAKFHERQHVTKWFLYDFRQTFADLKFFSDFCVQIRTLI